MRNPILAIGWSMWARHRAANLAMLAAIPICAVLYQIFRAMIPSRLAAHHFVSELPLTLVPMAASFVWILCVGAQTETDAKRGFSGLPERLFAHPVRTRFLVLCHMGFGVAAIVLIHLAWSWGVFAPLGVQFEMRWSLVLAALAMVSFQGAVWGLASFPWLRAVVICAGGLFIGPLLAVSCVPEMDWDGHEAVYALITLSAIPVVCGAALITVRAERRGGWQPWAPVRRFLHRVYDIVFLRHRAFAGPSQATVWLEWRRKGWILVLAVALSVAGSFLMMPVEALLASAADLPPWIPVVQGFFWPVFLGATMGSAASKTDWGAYSAISPFQAIKPISTSELVFVKMRVGALAIVLGWIVAVPLALGCLFWPQWRELCLNTESQAMANWLLSDLTGFWWLGGMILVTGLMTWQGFITSMTFSLEKRAFVVPLKSFCWLLSLPLTGSAALLMYRRPGVIEEVGLYLWIILVVILAWKLVASVRAFVEARRRSLWTQDQLLIGVALWLLVASGVVAGILLCRWKLEVPVLLMMLATVSLWPGGELARSVINLADNRHR